MKRTFENYLIMVGIRTADYTYTDEQIFDNTEYFKKCYDDNLSAYKALLFLHDHLQEVEARDKQSINYDGLLGTGLTAKDIEGISFSVGDTVSFNTYTPDKMTTVRKVRIRNNELWAGEIPIAMLTGERRNLKVIK